MSDGEDDRGAAGDGQEEGWPVRIGRFGAGRRHPMRTAHFERAGGALTATLDSGNGILREGVMPLLAARLTARRRRCFNWWRARGPWRPRCAGTARGLDAACGQQVGLRGRDGVKLGEVDAGLEVPLRPVERAEVGMGRHDVAGEVLAPNLAVGVALLGGEQAGPVEVEERRQDAQGEAVDGVGAALPDKGRGRTKRRTTWAFSPSTSALSSEVRARDLVKRSTRSSSTSSATRWLMHSLPLSAWKPRMRNGKDSSRPSGGSRQRSEMSVVAPTNSYCVISSAKLIR